MNKEISKAIRIYFWLLFLFFANSINIKDVEAADIYDEPYLASFASKGFVTKKQGSAIVTRAIGNKKQSAKLKARGTVRPPGKVKKLSVKSKRKSRTCISWKKVPDAEYYQLHYSAEKNFKRKKTIQEIRKEKITIYFLEKRKTYYFRVRAYKWVDNKKVYGKWSKVVKKPADGS